MDFEYTGIKNNQVDISKNHQVIINIDDTFRSMMFNKTQMIVVLELSTSIRKMEKMQ